MMVHVLSTLLLFLLLASVHGFHVGLHCVRSQVWMAAAQDNQSNTDNTTTSLSGLVSNMLSAHREMETEMNESLSVCPGQGDVIPRAGEDGIYRIISEEQYRDFLTANTDKLVILKISSSLCRACKMLQEKFRGIGRDEAFNGFPVVFADILTPNQPDNQFAQYVHSHLHVVAVPSIHFYAPGNQLVANFGCGPTQISWTQLKQKMAVFVQEWTTVDPNTHETTAITVQVETEISSHQHERCKKKRSLQFARFLSWPLQATRARIQAYFSPTNKTKNTR